MECSQSLSLAVLLHPASEATPEKLRHPTLLLLGHHCQQLSESAGTVPTANLTVNLYFDATCSTLRLLTGSEAAQGSCQAEDAEGIC